MKKMKKIFSIVLVALFVGSISVIAYTSANNSETVTVSADQSFNNAFAEKQDTAKKAACTGEKKACTDSKTAKKECCKGEKKDCCKAEKKDVAKCTAAQKDSCTAKKTVAAKK